jgi:hypothetical protein
LNENSIKMDSVEETCKICQQTNGMVLDGVCEKCEPIWLQQIGIISRQQDENTRLADLFEQAAKAAKEVIQNSTNS